MSMINRRLEHKPGDDSIWREGGRREARSIGSAKEEIGDYTEGRPDGDRQ